MSSTSPKKSDNLAFARWFVKIFYLIICLMIGSAVWWIADSVQPAGKWNAISQSVGGTMFIVAFAFCCFFLLLFYFISQYSKWVKFIADHIKLD